MKNRATALQSRARAGLQQAKKKPSGGGSSGSTGVSGSTYLLGGLALAAGAFVGGIVLERRKGLTGQAEEAVAKGKAKVEEKKEEFKRKAEATKTAIKDTIYGYTDPDWTQVTEFYQYRIIKDVKYEIMYSPEEGATIHANGRQLEGPGENLEWTTVNAAKKYIDRITTPRKNSGKGRSAGKGAAAEPSKEQLALRQEALDTVSQHGQRREHGDPEQFMHMVCLYPSARDFDAKGEPDPQDSLLGAYENLDSPDVLACLTPGMIVDVFVCIPCEDDDEEPEVIDNVTVELTGKPMRGAAKAPAKAAMTAPVKAPAKAPAKAPTRAIANKKTPAARKGRKA